MLADGVALHERTRLTGLRAGSPSVLETPHGRLRAAEVVLATNAWLTAWKPAGRHLTNFGSYVVLTEPVPDLLAEIGWTDGLSISDGRMFLHYFRTTPDGRVAMGSGSGPLGPGGAVDARFFDRLADRRTGRSAGSASCCPRWPPHGSSGPGAGRSTCRPTTCRSSARCRARASTTERATPAAVSGQAGSAGRSLASLVLRADDE